jgi:hypothetical protein
MSNIDFPADEFSPCERWMILFTAKCINVLFALKIIGFGIGGILFIFVMQHIVSATTTNTVLFQISRFFTYLIAAITLCYAFFWAYMWNARISIIARNLISIIREQRLEH